MNSSLSILGTRGIPAQHGGFETFAEQLALYLVRHDWQVTVYCQGEGSGDVRECNWNGVKLVRIPIKQPGAFGTMLFDWRSTRHAAADSSLILTLGYNTAIFCIYYRLKGKVNVINMDGIEWKRAKWSALERAWLYINERLACILGNQLVADHPEIRNYLSNRVRQEKIKMIPYGAHAIENANAALLNQFGLQAEEYAVVIARPEPENSILEIVSAFSSKVRNKKLVVLGAFDRASTGYCRRVLDAASEEVIFPGAIYEQSIVRALRFYSLLYIHGHQVGGTNPSLVEALGAGSAVLAHDNKFNRWVAGETNQYFDSTDTCGEQIDQLLNDRRSIERMRQSSRAMHRKYFAWNKILKDYDQFLREQIQHPR